MEEWTIKTLIASRIALIASKTTKGEEKQRNGLRLVKGCVYAKTNLPYNIPES